MPDKTNSVGQARGKRIVDTAKTKLRAFLVGVEVFSQGSSWNAMDSLTELALLADTAGLEVVGSIYQKVVTTVPQTLHRTWQGSGDHRQAYRNTVRCGCF